MPNFKISPHFYVYVYVLNAGISIRRLTSVSTHDFYGVCIIMFDTYPGYIKGTTLPTTKSYFQREQFCNQRRILVEIMRNVTLKFVEKFLLTFF